MTATASAAERRPRTSFWSSLANRQLDAYPDTGLRYGLLALVVVITTMLYYELYVGASVAPLQLQALHMSFKYYVVILAVGNLVGAFGSLTAGLTDRIGRCNLVVVGLLLTGVLTLFVIPNATTKLTFGIEYFLVGLVEGICLVATPALIRDFSPQVGRGSAMGFWTMGPVLGSLAVAVVGSNTIGAHTTWPHEYRICGVAGVAVFVLAALFLRELSPALRDQLMVSTRDRALVEARAKGLDIDDALRRPFRQLLKLDIVVSALGVSLLLLSYYTAVAFGTIFYETVFGFSLNQANGLGNWTWSINIVALVIAGFLSDKVRVRKPFMVVGGVWAAIATVVFLSAIGHHESYYHMVVLTALVSFGLGLGYVSWMASFTESVEARNPALTATGLAIWGWIIRVTIFVAFLVLPSVVNAVNPLVDYGATAQTIEATYPTQVQFATTHASLIAFAQKNATTLGFASAHPALVASASKDSTQLATLSTYGAEVKVIAAHQALFTRLAADPTSASLQAQAVAAGGGGAKGLKILTTIAAHQAAITGALQFAAANPSLVTQATRYSKQLGALAALQRSNPTQVAAVSADARQLAALQAPKVTAALQYLEAHGAAITNATAHNSSEWRHWYWVCFGGVVFFLLCIPLLKGRWSPSKAKADEAAHEAMVQAELAKLNA